IKTRELDSIEPRCNKCLDFSFVRGMFRISAARSHFRSVWPRSRLTR
ncbi:hypothetical protein ALC62_13705, partial [Cyphomyrmex costatus]